MTKDAGAINIASENGGYVNWRMAQESGYAAAHPIPLRLFTPNALRKKPDGCSLPGFALTKRAQESREIYSAPQVGPEFTIRRTAD